MFKWFIVQILFCLFCGILKGPMTWAWEKIFHDDINDHNMPWSLAAIICFTGLFFSFALCWDWITEDRPSKEAREILRKFSEEHEEELKQMAEWDSAYYDYNKIKYDNE